MAQATVAHRRTAARSAALRAKQRRTKILVIVLLVALAGLLAFQIPRILKLVGGEESANTASSASTATDAGASTAEKVPAILRRPGTGAVVVLLGLQ